MHACTDRCTRAQRKPTAAESKLPQRPKLILNKAKKPHAACRTQQTGQTGYGAYKYKPNELVYYQANDGSKEWHLGRSVLRSSYREHLGQPKELVWVVWLAEGDTDASGEYYYEQFGGHTLIPAAKARFPPAAKGAALP